MPVTDAPLLQHYRTWLDQDGYHARLRHLLPQAAIDYGCRQEVHATDRWDLIQSAIHNQVLHWCWQGSTQSYGIAPADGLA
ncbi:hypothetical protein [Nonomuraea pusilla]|nr:hypothetical protein [Nonomuraea pusilla]